MIASEILLLTHSNHFKVGARGFGRSFDFITTCRLSKTQWVSMPTCAPTTVAVSINTNVMDIRSILCLLRPHSMTM